MRYLNKIVFINSAHIKYAEVRLDGNVHFIGTQGVGKSTLLRAILFFYNADKSHLGIGREQQPFDAFYLPKQDSYIIYEVQRENGRFFIVAFLSQGRTAFRFVDCEYDRRFFLSEEGEVYYEWGRISNQIGNHYKSNIVRSYQAYLDIIYGNRQNVDTALRRFSLMESAKYQNIPRTIQNIFLNQSLESRVIKDTIIDSMDFAGGGTDLNFYRDHVKDFRLQYDDIWKWYRRERNGHVKVRDEADDVISRYALFEGARQQIADLCACLHYALQRDRQRMPELQADLAQSETELQRQKRLLGEEKEKYQKEFGRLMKEEGDLEGKLGRIKEKRQYYDHIGISDILRRMAEEEALVIRKQGVEKQMEVITAKSQDVRRKYEALLQIEDDNRKQAERQTANDKKLREVEGRERVGQLQQEYQNRRTTLQDICRQKLTDCQEQINVSVQEKATLGGKALKIKTMNPYQPQMDEVERHIADLQQELSACQLRQKDIEKSMMQVSNEAETLRTSLRNQAELKVQQLEVQICTAENEMAQLDNLLSRQKGSLIEWLDTNVKGWEKNIGKVVDEEHILYNVELHPSLAGNSDTVFGVRLRLDNIDRTVRTPADIIDEKHGKEEVVRQLHRDIAQTKQSAEDEFERQSHKAQEQLRQLRKERMDIDVKLRQIPQLLDKDNQTLAALQEQLVSWRASELAANKQQLVAVEQRIEQLKEQQRAAERQLQRELDKLKKDIACALKEAKADTEHGIKALGDDLKQRLAEITANKKHIEAQMDAALHGAGVDVEQLQLLRTDLQKINTELDYIKQHCKDYYDWQKDKAELLDHEQEYKEQRQLLKQKIDELQEKFDNRSKRLSDTICRLSNTVAEVKFAIQDIETNSKAVESFIASDTYPRELAEVAPKETSRPLRDLLEEVKQQIYRKQQHLDKFKEAVSTFKKNFSAQNTFNFRTEFNVETDYMDFAVDLNEFVANQKIEEYRARISENYSHIINRISKEVGDLMSNKGMIEKTISDINRDFEISNFTGVIKHIELRSDASNDRLTQHLFNIKKFCDEQVFNIGELNLFSDETSRESANKRAVELLMTLMDRLDAEQKRDRLTLADTFKLSFKVKENDNETQWVEKLSNVGSDGTDILVKAMVNIMLINVFKRKISKKFGDFRLHCMMDEIGKLHPNNVKGILDFASARNIYLVNSSPTTYTAEAYRYTYLLSKDSQSNTVVKSLLTIH